MIYLDNAATTKPSIDAIKFAESYLTEDFFNPSALYKDALKVKKAIDYSRQVILTGLSATNHEVIFTSCGTESDNMAIFGFCRRGSFITTEGEHSAVYKTALELKNRGINVLFAKLNKDGTVNEEDLLNKVSSAQSLSLVSIVHVNNETGAINNVNDLAQKIKKISPTTLFHTDGVQSFMKIPFALTNNIDLYSLSAHKINGLKGVGALVKKKGLTIPPFIFGGGQENGLRSGTENVFGIKVLEYCTSEKHKNLTDNFNSVSMIHNRFVSKLDTTLFDIISSENCSPYILSLSAKGVKGEVVMHMLEKEGIIVGNGSACSSRNRFSRVIEACGYKNNDGIIRISFSPDIAVEDAEFSATKLNQVTKKLSMIMRK